MVLAPSAQRIVALTLCILGLTMAAPVPALIGRQSTEPDSSLDDTTSGSDSSSEVACNPVGRAGIDNGILKPVDGANITMGQEFEVRYCSPTFHA